MSVNWQVNFWRRRSHTARRRRPAQVHSKPCVEQLEQRHLFDIGLGSTLGMNGSAHFVAGLYQDLLHRTPQQVEVAGWTGALEAGVGRGTIVQAFLRSTEYRTNVIRKDYETFLGREPEPGVLAGWLSSMDKGATAQQLMAVFLSSAEDYLNHGGNPADWLTGVYGDLLGRKPDTGGLANWSRILESGVKRETVALAFVYSAEEQGRQVGAAYQDVLGRSADPGGMQNWATALQHGLTLEQLTVAVAASGEYYNQQLGTDLPVAGVDDGNDAVIPQARASDLGALAVPYPRPKRRRLPAGQRYGGNPDGAGARSDSGGSGSTDPFRTDARTGPIPPLTPGNWVPIGPAPITNAQVPGNQAASGRLTGLAADPSNVDVIYVAAAGGGVWKTVDGGTSWIPLTDNQPTLTMGAIALAPSNPSILYAGTGESDNAGDSYYGRGVLKSTDGGASWALLGNAQFNRKAMTKIAIDPTNPNTVYVAVADAPFAGSVRTTELNNVPGNDGIWKSTDGGATWTNTTTGISTTDAYTDVVIDSNQPQTVYAAVGTSGGAAPNGVYKTTDGGTTWAAAGNFPGGTGDSVIRVAIAKSNPATLYASIADPKTSHLSKMEKSTDSGATWTQLTSTPDYMGLPNLPGQGDYDSTLAVDPRNDQIVYAGGAGNFSTATGTPVGSLFVGTTDGGNTWTDLSGVPGNANGPHADHHAIGFDASGKVLVGTDGGIWRLENPAGSTWSDLNSNLQITQFVGIAAHPANPNIAYGGSQDNGVEKFTGALGWTRVQFGDSDLVRIDNNNPNTVYHAFPTAFGVPFERSDDGGNSWTIKNTGINPQDPANFYLPYVVDPSNTNRLLLGTDRVYETLDRGDNWKAISAPGQAGWVIQNGTIDTLAAAPSDPNTIYAAVSPDIYVTNDHGASWNKRNVAGFPAGEVFGDLAVDPNNRDVAYALHTGFGNGQVFRTVNGGQTWTNISGNLPDIPANTIAVDGRSAATVLYVGTDDGVYVSRNGGASWSRFGQGLPRVRVSDLQLVPALNFLAAGTYGRGMFEISLTPVSATSGGGGGVVGPPDRFDPNETSDQAFGFGLLNAGTQTEQGLSLFNRPDRLPRYDWYRWTVSQDGTVTVSINYTTTSGGDFHLRLYTLDSNNSLVQLASSRAIGSTSQTVSIPMTGSQPLLVWVYGFNHETGTYDLSVTLQ